MTINPKTFRLLGNRLLIQFIADPKKKTGIVIPDVVEKMEKHRLAKVLVVGSGRWSKQGNVILPEFKKGDTVLFSGWGGITISEDIRIVSAEDVIGRVGI